MPNERPDSTVVTASNGAVITFDRAGRLYSMFLEGRFYRRGVDGRVVVKHTADGRTIRRPLEPADARALEARALELAGDLPGVIRDLEVDAARFREAYDGPIPILPPDLYRALVLQATVGCSYNGCDFCRLYAGRRFRVRGPEEFEEHARGVAAAFGAGLSMRRGLFLGDADALAAGTARLVAICGAARELAPAREGLYCFGTVLQGPSRDRAQWEELREAGLRRVYLGIETGHDPLRNELKKPGTRDDARRTVAALKEAGIAVGLIFLLGIGGPEHVADSAALCNAADLDAQDFVYLSPLVGADGTLERKRGGYDWERKAMRESLEPGPRVAVYDIRTFVY